MTRHTPTPIIRQAEVDSAADRAALHEIIRGMQSNCARHETRFQQIATQGDEHTSVLTKVKFAAYLAVLLLAGIVVGGRWVVRHAVTDALVEQGILRIQHPAAMLETPKGGG